MSYGRGASGSRAFAPRGGAAWASRAAGRWLCLGGNFGPLLGALNNQKIEQTRKSGISHPALPRAERLCVSSSLPTGLLSHSGMLGGVPPSSAGAGRPCARVRGPATLLPAPTADKDQCRAGTVPLLVGRQRAGLVPRGDGPGDRAGGVPGVRGGSCLRPGECAAGPMLRRPDEMERGGRRGLVRAVRC